MKKVLHILNSLLPSGAETMLVTSADLWVGYEKHVLATQKELGSYAEKFEKAGYIVHHIFGKKKHKRIRQLIKNENFDVVHIHTEASSSWYALDARLVGTRKIVRTVHNVFKSQIRNEILRYVSRLRKTIRRHFETDFLGVKYIAIGDSVYRNELELYRNPCAIIRNWCDENIYVKRNLPIRKMARNRLGIGKDVFCVLTVGNCNKIKNHSLLIRAIHSALAQRPDFQIIYLHVGSGDEEQNEKTLVKQLGLTDKVKFVGRQNPLEYYNAADLYVMPSLFEGLSISALEAARCNVPILLTDVDGLKDFQIIDDPNLIYSSLKTEDMANRLVESYDRWQKDHAQMTCDISNIIGRYFNMDKSVKEYLAVYNG